METLYIEASSIECSEERREISGKIVPMGTGEVGHTNLGGVVFEAGSIDVTDISKIKLLSQHDMKKPVGRMTAAEVRPDGIYATFKLSRSTGGNDALIQAQEGLVSGLSIGAEVIASKPSRDGHTVVSSARLKEVSLVTEPAFKSAQVLEIAAEEVIPAEPTQPESEPVVEETTTPVEAPAVEAAAVEAARPTVAASFTTRERTAPISSSQYLDATIKAAMGDDNARRTVLAADDSTTTNTGLTLPGHLNQFVTTSFTGRPAFEAVTRNALPDAGMSFTIPKLTTAPTVADVNEGATITAGGMESGYDTITVNKFAGRNFVSWELIDRSSPAFMDLLMAEIRKAYEKATDEALIAAFTASGTQATGVAATAAGLQSFISAQAAAAYKATGGDRANKLVASTDQWAAITGYADTTGRPLYSAQGATYNAAGEVVPTSNMGNVLGTDLIVDHNIATSGIVDESAFLVAPGSAYVWESPVTNLRVQQLASGQLEIALYGYLAIGILKGGAGVRRFNLS
jgi:HK97 family phage prohead protease/HK97 family phage major capsid protein